VRCRFCVAKTALASVSSTSLCSGFQNRFIFRSVLFKLANGFGSVLPDYLDRRICKAKFPTHINSLPPPSPFSMSGIPLNLPSTLKTFCSPVQACYHNTSLLFTAEGQLYAQFELPLGSLLLWDITHVGSYQRFGTSCRLHLEGSSSAKHSVTNFPSTPRNTPVLQRSNLQHGGNLQS